MVPTAKSESGREDADTTLWVIIALVVVAALAVIGSRLRLRR
jgi:hypothetical protein